MDLSDNQDLFIINGHEITITGYRQLPHSPIGVWTVSDGTTERELYMDLAFIRALDIRQFITRQLELLWGRE